MISNFVDYLKNKRKQKIIMKQSLLLFILLLIACTTMISCGNPASLQTRERDANADPRQSEASPSLTGSLDTLCAEDIAVYEKFLYVADGPGGLLVVDASSPSKLMLRETIASTYAFRVYIHLDNLYLCDGPAGLKVYSLDDPSRPLQVYTHDSFWAEGIAFANGYLYLADYYEGIKIFELDPAGLPITMESRDIARARDIIIDGQTMLLSDHVFGLVVYDMNSPTDFLWTYNKSDIYANYEDIISIDGYTIIARNDEISTLSIFRTSDAYNIELMDELHPVRFLSGITRSGDVLLIAGGKEGVLAFDLKDPTAIELLWIIHTNGFARRAKAHGKFLYVADMAGIGVYEIDGMEGEWE
jgi:hypothetical protein